MLKGTSQSRRNNAWHIKNTKKKATIRLSHVIRSLNRGNGVAQFSSADKQYRKALEREKLKSVGLRERIQLGFKKLFNFNKTRYA